MKSKKMSHGRRGLAALTVVMTGIVILALASLAWACTGQSRVVSLTPRVAPVGTDVLLEGQGVMDNKVVEIRWNDINGPKLAETISTAQGTYSVSFKIPEAPSDVHFVVAVSEFRPGINMTARMAIEVGDPSTQSSAKPSAASAGSRDLWNGFSTSQSTLGGAEAVAGASDPGIAGEIPASAALFGTAALGLLGGAVAAAATKRRRASASS